jgi:hypothetical protein
MKKWGALITNYEPQCLCIPRIWDTKAAQKWIPYGNACRFLLSLARRGFGRVSLRQTVLTTRTSTDGRRPDALFADYYDRLLGAQCATL